MEGKVFRSRVSFIYVLIFGALLLFGWYFYNLLGGLVGLIGLIIIWILTIFIPFALRSMYYVLTDKEIQIYYLWGMRGKFFISAISSVQRSYNQLNAPAASLKRLGFHFRKGYKWDVYFSSSPFFVTALPSISPVREQEFLETLKTLNPNIHINVTDKKRVWWRFWDWDI